MPITGWGGGGLLRFNYTLTHNSSVDHTWILQRVQSRNHRCLPGCGRAPPGFLAVDPWAVQLRLREARQPSCKHGSCLGLQASLPTGADISCNNFIGIASRFLITRVTAFREIQRQDFLLGIEKFSHSRCILPNRGHLSYVQCCLAAWLTHYPYQVAWETELES